jgi:hypothetical protein
MVLPGTSRAERMLGNPAMPAFRQLLAHDYAVILGVSIAPAEQEILERWERELGMRFERRFSAGPIAIARSRSFLAVWAGPGLRRS